MGKTATAATGDLARTLREAREREAALRQILDVISRSRDDERPVFRAILENVSRLCDAPLALMALVNPERTHLNVVAHLGARSKFMAYNQEHPVPLDSAASMLAEAVIEKAPVHVADLTDTDLYREGQTQRVMAVDEEGMRTALVVPLIAGDRGIGSLCVYRREVKPFSDEQIALVETFAQQAVIAIENVRQFRELQARLAREAATREILEVISRSRADEGPVFEAILENAARLCDAPLAFVTMVNEERTLLELKGHKGDSFPDFVDFLVKEPLPLEPKQTETARAVLECRTIQIEDLRSGKLYDERQPHRMAAVGDGGIRTLLIVPLVLGGVGIGAFNLWRREVSPFSDSEIALVETFAAQAVIAIENVRQFRELQTRLEREAASREILGVISRSRADARPVFDVIIEQASRLCDAPFAAMALGSDEDSIIDIAAQRGSTPAQFELYVSDPIPNDPAVSYSALCVRDRRSFQIEDMGQSDLYRSGSKYVVNSVETIGIRTALYVPLLSGDRAIGSLTLFKREVQPFTPEQVTLVETFAAQAVIAIENVRQFRELQTRLEREAASREILGVISQSRDDEAPVFEVMLECASRLFGAPLAGVHMLDESGTTARLVAQRGLKPETLAAHDLSTPVEGPNSVARAITERSVQHSPDLKDDELYRRGYPTRVAIVDVEGARSALVVPLVSGGAAIGSIFVFRREVRPYTDDEIALLQTFAAQAVIAIENVRQFRELQTRLQREKATREILQVISRSRDDEGPVFDAILENAAQLCEAPMASLNLLDEDGGRLVLRAHWGAALDHFEADVTEWALDGASAPAEAVRSASLVHIEDFAETEAYKAGDPVRVNAVEKEGIRTFLAVPLLRDGKAIGTIALFRREVRPFGPDQVALVESFAAQAVIAIQNVRQFRAIQAANAELESRLEREAASKEILEIISRSRDDDQPVFDVIIDSARRLCDAKLAAFVLGQEGGGPQVMVAHHGATAETLELYRSGQFPMDPTRSYAARAIIEKRPVHVEDLADTDAFRENQPQTVSLVEQQGIRTNLLVPLISGGKGIGCLILYRDEVRPYTSDQIALVETFAAQAVIAIENVRQFRELQTRLEREAASREILQIISRSRDDDLPVFDVILQNASKLCDAPLALLGMVNQAGTHLEVVAHRGAGQKYIDFLLENPATMDSPLTSVRAIVEMRSIMIDDMTGDSVYEEGVPQRMTAVEAEGIEAFVAVPLISGGAGIGAIILYRKEKKAFSESEIALAETFAAQAVIAIENVRQFRELQTRLEREAASREILGVISQSRDDDLPVFNTIMESAARLCKAPHAGMLLPDEANTHLELVASNAATSKFIDLLRENPHSLDSETSRVVEAFRSMEVRHHHDLADSGSGDVAPQVKLAIETEGMRTVLLVPLISGRRAIGVFFLYKLVVEPFSEDEIALVETFAAQAVIAIENVRQFRAIQTANTELETRLEREAATAEVLSVISRSRDDDLPVFRTITEAVARLCEAPLAYICILDDARSHVTIPAQIGARPEFAERLARFREPVENDWLLAVRSALRREVVRIDDLSDDDLYRDGNEYRVKMVDEEGMRSVLAVPLISGDHGVGCIFLYRRDVAPFSDEEVSLVRGFAAQAVIAIENVRQFRELQTRLEREAATSDVLQVINRSRDDEQPVFRVILENASRLCRAPLAFLTVANEERTRVTLPAYRGVRPEFAATAAEFNEPIERSDLVAVKAIADGKVIRSADLKADVQHQSQSPWRHELVEVEGVRSIMVVPMMNRGKGVGAIILYRREVSPFSDDDLALVQAFAAQAVIALENVRQFKALEARTEEVQALNASLEARVETQVGEIERMGKLKSFLPAAVADAVVSSGSDAMLKSHRALLGILFCDMRGFTAFCETAEPEETIEVLQTYHQEMGRLIAEHGAGVDHRMGDGIMVLFNDPLPCDDPAGEAVRLAMAMRARMAELCKDWKKLGHRLGFGVGISLGYATVGMVGYEGRSEYTASGTAVNLAARLCDRAEDGEILLSPRAHIAVEDTVKAEPAGAVELKGISAPVEVFRVVAG